VTSSSKILAYCVTERSPQRSDLRGVADQTVQQLDFQGLVILYSDFSTARTLNQDDALRFHSVLRSVFDHQALIPFRFPTFVEDEASLQSHLREKHSKYSADLGRLRESVQMEVRISRKREEKAARSGKEYLQAKLQQSRSLQEAVRAIRDSVADIVPESKERPTEHGLRLFALTKRSDAAAFRERILKSPPGAGFTIAVSGPWPPAEFLDE